MALNGKAAIVTGVGDRAQVGFAVAQALVAAGARVCITGRRENVHELAGEIGGNTIAVQCDLLDQGDVERLVASAREQLGGIDILVNVAGGLSLIKPIVETSLSEWQREVQRNSEPTFLVTRTALPALRERSGCVINFASPAGERAAANLGAYSAGKAAVIALTRALAIEEKGRVRVNAIAPGMIDTGTNRQSVADASKVKWVTRAQIASAVVFLASDASSGVTGETLKVLADGIS